MKGNKKSIMGNNRGMIAMLPTIAFSVIMLFAIMYIGTYINGTIGAELEDTLPSNLQTGEYDNQWWYNGTVPATGGGNLTRNTTLPCTINNLDTGRSRFFYFANGTAFWLNLTVNNNKANDTTHITPAGTAGNWTLAELITATHISPRQSFINFTWNATTTHNVGIDDNRFQIRLVGDYFADGDQGSTFENRTINTLGNLSVDYESTVDIVVVAAIIVVLTVPLMAVVAIKKLL